MQTIENNQFKAEIDEHGAQLTHLVNKAENFDYIWNDELWPKHSPVLFPAIGRSTDDAYLYEGQEYEMPQHGFVADQDFQVENNDGTTLSLFITANAATKQFYPFDFKFTVTFTLSETGLAYAFKIENQDQKQLSFSIGSHPAFNLPINDEGSFEDYTVDFKPAGLDLKQFEIIKTPNPYRTGKIIPIENSNGSQIHLNYDMFEKGLVIVENDGVEGLTISSAKTGHTIEVDLHDFRYVCLWTKEGAHAKFLCVEPFQGLPDIAGQKVELLQKEGNVLLNPQETKTFSYQITLS